MIKDLRVTISLPLLRHAHDTIVAKANKLLGPLKWACPLITDVNVRRTLYLFLVKSQVRHATQVNVVTKPALVEDEDRACTKASHRNCRNVVKK